MGTGKTLLFTVSVPMFCQTCCLHLHSLTLSMEPADSPVILVPIYQTQHQSPEDSHHYIHCCDNSDLILHSAASPKLTQILGQFLQAFPLLQTANTEQTAT
jgi:hypothetical protein